MGAMPLDVVKIPKCDALLLLVYPGFVCLPHRLLRPLSGTIRAEGKGGREHHDPGSCRVSRLFLDANLGGFLENDEFSPRRCHPLGLQQEIAQVLVATAPA
jgi:hypothetical protein